MEPNFDSKLDAYARLAVEIGVNVQPGQRLVIVADIETAGLTRLLAKHAYRAGASLVDVIWGDDELNLVRLKYAPRDSFGETPGWYGKMLAESVKRDDALISILSKDPSLYEEQDAALVAIMTRARLVNASEFSELIDRDATNWLVIAMPTPAWAGRVFPDEPDERRLAHLWEEVFQVSGINEIDPVATWNANIRELRGRCEYLDAKQYKGLHYAGPGTALEVGLAPNHIWIGGASLSENGIWFLGNLPTYEVFTAPNRLAANGQVTSTMPLSVHGTLIQEFTLEFQEGRVTHISTSNDLAVLEKYLATDEGASYLGEVALVPQSSPVARTGIQFFNGLLDENAACHLALGSAYATNLKNSASMSQFEMLAAGLNRSVAHLDFMVGSADLDIDGICADGTREAVMRGGEWAFQS